MRKTLFLTIVFCAVFMYLPFSANAAGIISAFNVEPTEAVAGQIGDYGLEVVLTAPVASGTTMAFLFMDENSAAADSFDVSTGSLIDGDLTGATYTADGPANIYIQVNQDLSAGTYNFGFADITISDEVGTYKLGMGFGTNFGSATDYTESNTFILTEPMPFTSVSAVSNGIAGAKVDQTYTLVTDSVYNGSLYIMYQQGKDGDPSKSGFDFSNATFSSDSTVSCEALTGMDAIAVCSATNWETGTHTITASKVVDSSNIDNFYLLVSDALGEGATVTFSDDALNIHKIGKLKKKKIKIKKKKSGRPLIKVKKRKLDTNWNKVKLYAKKSSKIEASVKKKWKRLKTKPFKKKQIRLKKRYFKNYTKYKVKWYSCYRYNDKKKTQKCGAATVKTFKLN